MIGCFRTDLCEEESSFGGSARPEAEAQMVGAGR